ncbi:MAG: peroxiredoxin [Verrucomicrobiales bacterium]|nr:peroxiredoxin [Verrucomicrobiales bacterium]
MSVLVGKQAPSFKASGVNKGKIVENFSLDQFKGKKYVLLFFYPKDFTFVCPTELHAFQDALEEFESRNVQVVGCSTDTEMSHWGWLQVPRNEGGIGGVTYPIVADTNKTISADYDVLVGDYKINEDGSFTAEGELIAYRGLFLIDKDGVVQHQVVNNLPLGRSVKEALRMVDALQHYEENGEVCPIDWNLGDEGMEATHESTAMYLSKNSISDVKFKGATGTGVKPAKTKTASKKRAKSKA